jgi:hypothetical protein
LLATGCGGSASSQDPVGQLVKYAACMRSHGLPTFPDPLQASEGATHSVGLHIPDTILNSPKYQTANHSCEKFAPSGFFPAA